MDVGLNLILYNIKMVLTAWSAILDKILSLFLKDTILYTTSLYLNVTMRCMDLCLASLGGFK